MTKLIDTNDLRKSIITGDYDEDELFDLCDEIDRLRKQAAVRECEAQRELAMDAVRQGTKQTVRVKVAVAVSSNGEWTAAGWHDGKRDVVVETAMDAAFFPANVYWLTAYLPVPGEVTVVAEVEK